MMPIAPSDTNKLLIHEQADQLSQNAFGSAATQIIVATLFYLLFNNSLNSELLLLWSTTLSLLVLIRLITVWRYKADQQGNAKKWLNTFTFITLLLGVTWASFGLFFLMIEDIGLRYLFFVIICGMVAGAVPILAAWTPAYYANTLPQLISWPAIMIYSNSTINTFLACSFVVYCLMLIKLQRNTNANIRKAFQLQYKNDDLVAELNTEIEQREQLIERRTKELNNSLSEKTAIANNKLIGIAIAEDRKIQWANSTFETMLAYNEGEVIGCPTRQFYVNEKDYQAVGEAYKSIASGVIKNELQFKRKDGKHIWVSVKGSVLDEDKGQSLWVFIEVTDRVEALGKLQLSSRVFNSTHDGIIITDANQQIIDVNPAFCDITGYSSEEAIGKNPHILSSGKQSPEFYTEMWCAIHEEGHWQGEIWNRRKNGEVYAELLTISELKDSNGNISSYVGIFSDITRSKQQQEKLKLLAHYDVLTKLPNRILFSDRFHQAISHSKRSETFLAVCFLDLDNFKPINDEFGHQVGDQLLIEVGHRISGCIREEDTVARLGGDEFALLIGDILSYEQCTKTMERVHYAIAEPYLINGISHKVTASSGIAFYPLDEGDVDTLLRYADQAMYLAKQEGRNRYQRFNTEQEQKASEKNQSLAEIRQALKNNEFELYYQPKVNMVTGDIFGVEALIRWNHPKHGLVPPLDFLPIIDGTDLEIQLGDWVINQALTQLDVWQKQGVSLEMSINISSQHLLSDSFCEKLDRDLAEFPMVNSQLLQLEILESSVLSDLKAITDIIKHCQNNLGVSFALDDFGTGYSSLTHLRNLPVGTVKIDQTFIRDMLDDPNDYAIIDGVIGLADSFNRNVIAEGVETTEHGLMLLLLGCEQAQGYGLAKPMPIEDFDSWLRDYKPNFEWQDCGNKQLSKKNCERKLFKLTTTHWKNKFEKNVLSESEETPNDWPIMDNTQCPCGSWLKRAQRAQIFDSENLKELKEAHEEFHVVANSIFSHYQQGDIDQARNGLKELQTVYDEMDAVLQSCH